MYKNSMLDKIDKSIGPLWPKDLADEVMENILNSQQFFMGNVLNFWDDAKKDLKILFDFDSASSLPFDSNLFCYTDNTGAKFSTLVFKSILEKHGPCVIVVTFMKRKNMDQWEYCPFFAINDLSGKDSMAYTLPTINWVEGSKEKLEEMACMCRNALVASYSIKLLNCKNVSIIDIKRPEKINRCRNKKGKLPLFEYKVLNVEIPGNKIKTSVGNGTGISQRVHLCRGHFKEYTTEKPLFGRLVGRYWWQPTVRGKGNGIIEKEYHVRVAS